VTRRTIGVVVLLAVVVIAGVTIATEKERAPFPPQALAQNRAASASVRWIPATSRPSPPVIKAAASGSIWARPTAAVTARHERRSGLAWILRQLGASDQLVNRLASRHVAEALTELKQRANAGDPKAINILGEFAFQQCYLGRSPAMLDEGLAMEVADARTLPPADAAWFDAVLREDIAYDKQVAAACQQTVNVDRVFELVKARARQGDGASLWLWSRSADNYMNSQQHLRDAAAAGFSEGEFELAWAIIGGQQGAAGSGPNKVNAGDMFRKSAGVLPRSEAELAVCEYRGCPGIATDLASAVSHAREAAQRGSIDAIITIGPRMQESLINPDEVSAWKLIRGSLAQQGCISNGINIMWMRDIESMLSSADISANARALADQYWQTYGARILANLGCNP